MEKRTNDVWRTDRKYGEEFWKAGSPRATKWFPTPFC